MTTILAAVAVVLFAILIAVCVFGFFLYQQEKWNERKDEIKAQPGPYRPVEDISSMLPEAFRPYYSFQSSSVSYDYRLRNIDKRISKLEMEVIDNDDELTLLERVIDLEERIGTKSETGNPSKEENEQTND